MTPVWKKIKADWKGDWSFIATNPKGGSIRMGSFDGNPGIGPMELVLVGLAGCTGGDIASILEKKRQPLEDLQVIVRGKVAEEYPKVYTEIQVLYLVWGNVSKEAVEQAIELSEEKYCSVGIMLRASTPIHSSYRILKPGEEYLEEVQEISA